MVVLPSLLNSHLWDGSVWGVGVKVNKTILNQSYHKTNDVSCTIRVMCHVPCVFGMGVCGGNIQIKNTGNLGLIN